MWVGSLSLRDFRNYVAEDVTLSPGVNLVVGANAQGKTNVLEAIYCLGGLGSPRGSEAAVVREGCDEGSVSGEVCRGERRVRLSIVFKRGRGSQAAINGTRVPSSKLLREAIVCVFFGPDDLTLVKGGPEARRRFLDDLVVKLRPARENLRREWERALRQRNALLRSAPRESRLAPALEQTLEVWDEALCSTGARLAAARLEALAALLPHASKRYEEIAGGGRLELSYESGWIDPAQCEQAMVDPRVLGENDLREALERELRATRRRELERGVSLVGPHRDDVCARLSSGGDPSSGMLDARAYASQGDQRTVALALKLAEHDLLKETLQDTPVLLLDDVFSELDTDRRTWLARAVGEGGQAVVSSAEPGTAASVPADAVLTVAAGRVVAR